MVRLFGVVLCVWLAGCAYTPTDQQLKSADYGAMPTAPGAGIRLYLSGSLLDAGSMQIEAMTAPKQDFYINPANFNTEFGYGWHVCALINAKNAYGGYAGFQPWHFWFKGEQVQWATNAGMNSGRSLRCD